LIRAGYGRCTVAKVQIGLTGTAVTLKRDLERIAKRADTNTSEGLNFVLQGAYCWFITEHHAQSSLGVTVRQLCLAVL
jgi:uncharacterized membrane protein